MATLGWPSQHLLSWDKAQHSTGSPTGLPSVPRWAPHHRRGATCEAQRKHLTLSHGEANCSLEREI